MDYILPSTVYQSPPRMGRGRQLNTILEDVEESSYATASDSDATIIGRPAALDERYFLVPPQKSQQWSNSPVSPMSAVSFSFEGGEDFRRPPSMRSSYASSDAGTVFSESCPSLTGSQSTDSTSYAMESGRNNSYNRFSSRNRYPSLYIPRESWSSADENAKHLQFGMSPSTKIMLSPEVLASLPRHVPRYEDVPSFSDNGSARSESPCLPTTGSIPATPDLHNLELIEGQSWGGRDQVPQTPLEIAIDEHHSILLSPAEAHAMRPHSMAQSVAQSVEWNDIMVNFPRIPGATPQENTPVTPNIPRGHRWTMMPSDTGVQLPALALDVLRTLTGGVSPNVGPGEMQERSSLLQPRNYMSETPSSEYSFSQLSIPSPGGFFSSLKAGARNTWASSPRPRANSPPPSSTTAENFYNTPWNRPESTVETVVQYNDSSHTDGPPTARQATFDSGLKTPMETQFPQDSSSSGASTPQSHPGNYEYEESYEQGLQRAASAHHDRTGDWLAAQTSYLSALRETNPLNDPADYPTSTAPVCPVEYIRKDSLDAADANKAVLFLKEARKTAVEVTAEDATVSEASSPPREPLFLEAFEFTRSEARRVDTFLQSSVRLQSVEATRIALPKVHVQSLLNDHSSKSLSSQHSRPKYRGPFSQNPRTGSGLNNAEDQDLYANLERQQHALAAILPNAWTVEAQSKILYNGRLLACSSAAERVARKSGSAEKGSKPARILDLGGNATASWAWAAATEWADAKVYTVQSKQQTSPHVTASGEDGLVKPENPANHRVIKVPNFWQLPFKSNYFDVISARTLHMYLRSTPVPGVSSIDEWDMTLKECMRVLKPGGILDFFVMDSGISGHCSDAASVSISPSVVRSTNAPTTLVVDNIKRKADAVVSEFRSYLQKRGYEQDGGSARLMGRLKKEGFVGVKRQWIALPMGQAAKPDSTGNKTHARTASNVTSAANRLNTEPSYKMHFNPDGTKIKQFRSAPRPVSEVSTLSRIVTQYLDCEAVQGPVGSTQDIADMSSLLGELLWEEWLVRLRIESGVRSNDLLHGVNEVFEDWRRTGKAAWKGIVGWARKPTRKELGEKEPQTWNEDVRPSSPVGSVSTSRSVSTTRSVESRSSQPIHGLRIDTSAGSGVLPTLLPAQRYNPIQHQRQAAHGLQRKPSVFSPMDYTQSAVDRGDVMEIPVMIIQ